MQRREKESHSFLFDLAFEQITKYTPYPYLNIGLLFIQHLLFLAKFYELISPGYFKSFFSSTTPFLVLASLAVGFLLLTLFSYCLQVLPTFWVYWLLLLEAFEMVYLEMGLQCFRGGEWCHSDPKLQTACLIVLGIVVLAVWLRSYCYCPFYETENPLSMTSGQIVLFALGYGAFLTVATDQVLTSTSASAQLVFLISFVFFSVNCNPPSACSPLMSRGFFISGATLLWTSCLIWLFPLFEEALGTNAGSIWRYWGFSTPIVICLSWVHSAKFRKGYEWRNLFFENHRELSLRDLFLQVNQLVKTTARIKKSELRTNGLEFRNLWGLVADHNDKCRDIECPLLSLESMRNGGEDQLQEQKRFSRTLEKILEYTLQKLTTQHDTYPNLLSLSLEIANFQLEVFHLRTKGLQLFNREWGRGRSTEDQWGVFFLKRKIQSFEGNGEGAGEREEEIEAFKHGIEVSVTMLAEFWYFLSDPKCNIKKLYDLANVLFPLKIGVDDAWDTVRTLRNIETYHLYAKYLIRMFNDKEKGLRILEEGRRLEIQAHEKDIVLAGNQGASEENGVIFLEFDGKNSGIMYQVNLACEKIFGYNRGELQGRKVNDIMPRLFAGYHDRILEHYQQTNRPRMMNKDRAVWGRSKDGFLFPFTICIKPVRNYFSQTSEVYASVKRDLWVKQKGFFFVDNELHITDMSASMILIYPDIAARSQLKKKVHLSELIPDAHKELPRLVEQREIIQQSVTRTYPMSSTQNFIETISFGIQAEAITVAVSGPIGYLFRVFKGSGITSYEARGEEEMKMEIEMEMGGKGMGGKRDFRLVGSVGEGGKRMVFQGGVTRDSNLLRSQMLSRISNCLEQERQLNNSELQLEVRLEYAGDIKTKRLQGNIIRQIHELSEDSELNRVVGPDNHDEEGSLSEAIKPCELNSILERETGNKSIILLKGLTITMLLLSTLLAVLEHASLVSSHAELGLSLEKYSHLASLQAQLMTLNQLANQLYIGVPINLTAFGQEVNLLDSLTPSLPLDVQAHLIYSDGSSQTMLLSFAINKLISEAQVIASGGGDSSQLFFLQYNTVNGLAVSCELALQSLGVTIQGGVTGTSRQCVLYLIICGSLFGVMLIAKNVVVRQVLQKKAQILNVFFQIPRYSCSSIQKECQRFIQRLSADNDEEELEMEALQSEEAEDSSNKRRSQQKKRTIMGEEKTSANFIFVSLLMLAFLLAYPLLGLTLYQQSQPNIAFVMDAESQALRMEKELSHLTSLMETHIVRPTFPLSEQSDGWVVIVAKYKLIMQMLTQVTSHFFLLGKVLDQQYLDKYNYLFYQDLCQSSSTCGSALGEDRGLNNIIFNLYDYLIAKYQLLQASSTPYNISLLYPQSTQLKDEGFRMLLKNYWRKLGEELVGGAQRLVVGGEGLLFGAMLGVCIVNCTVLIWGWIRFYNSLEKKMVATEYILTFIPIDEINKNPKIVRYIKDQVLRIQ